VAIFLKNDLGSYGLGPFAATVTLTPTAGSGAAVAISVSYQPGSSNAPAVLAVIPSADNPNYLLTLGYNTNGICRNSRSAF